MKTTLPKTRKPLQVRYLCRTVPISRREALLIKTREIASLKSEVALAKEALDRVRKSPLPKTIPKWFPVKEGDDGFKDAAYTIDIGSYSGEWKWITPS